MNSMILRVSKHCWQPYERNGLQGGVTTGPQVRAVFTGVFLHEHKKQFLKVSQVEHVEVAPPVD